MNTPILSDTARQVLTIIKELQIDGRRAFISKGVLEELPPDLVKYLKTNPDLIRFESVPESLVKLECRSIGVAVAQRDAAFALLQALGLVRISYDVERWFPGALYHLPDNRTVHIVEDIENLMWEYRLAGADGDPENVAWSACSRMGGESKFYSLAGDWQAVLTTGGAPDGNDRKDWSQLTDEFTEFLKSFKRNHGCKSFVDKFFHKTPHDELTEVDRNRFYEAIKKKFNRLWDKAH